MFIPQSIKIGHNVKVQPWNLSENRVQLRFIARALAEVANGGWELVSKVQMTLGAMKITCVSMTNGIETRHVLGYWVKAIVQNQFIVTLERDEDGNLIPVYATLSKGAKITIPANLADGNNHLVYSIVVEKTNEKGEAELSLSRSRTLNSFQQLVGKQREENVNNVLHPFSIAPTGAIMAAVLLNKQISIVAKSRQNVVRYMETFYLDQERIMAGLPYVKPE